MAKAARKKRGPKPKPPEQVRTVPMKFVVTQQEKATIERAAEITGKPTAEYMRNRVLPHAQGVVEKAGG